MELNERHNSRRHLRRFHVERGGRARRLGALVVLATAVLGATAACTGSSSPTGSGGTSAAGSSVSPSVTSTQPTGTSTGTGAAASTTATSAMTASGAGSSSSAGSHAVAGGSSACTGTEIKVTLGQSTAGLSHAGVPLVFTNTSSATCTMQGYPGAAIMKGSTVVLNSTRTLNGYFGDERQLDSAPVVTLAPGATASAMLEYVGGAGETCYKSGTGTLEVTPPNTTSTTGLIAMTAGSDGVCADFDIHPVVAGTLY